MRIAICTIARMENRYIREYVKYYHERGIDKIYLYDNNNVDGENFHDVIGDYIDNGFVEVIDFRTGHKFVQVVLDAYQDCYDKHKNEYDWICYFDPDEYLVVEGNRSIKEWLSQAALKDFQLVHVNWMTYDDSGLLEDDGRDLNVRFTHAVETNHPENHHIKSIIRGGLEGLEFTSPHTPQIPKDYKVCNGVGRKLENTIKTDRVYYKGAWLKHFRCKTVTEYMENKLPKLTLSGYHNISFDDTFFFSINQETEEKRAIYERILAKYLLKDYSKIVKKKPCKYSVLTCVFGDDPLFDVATPKDGVEYVCVTDNPNLKSKTWTIKTLGHNLPRIASWKYPKFHPFEYVSNDICMYVDATIEMLGDVTPLIETFSGSEYNIGFYPHPLRCEMQKEIDRWVQSRGFDKQTAERLIEYYDKEQYSSCTMFFCCSILYRKSSYVENFSKYLWEMMKEYGIEGDVCRSDQMLIPYIVNNMEVPLDNIMLLSPKLLASSIMQRYNRENWFAWDAPQKDVYTCFDGLIKPFNI